MDDLNVSAPQTSTSNSSCQQCTVTLFTRVKATLNFKNKKHMSQSLGSTEKGVSMTFETLRLVLFVQVGYWCHNWSLVKSPHEVMT